MRSEKEIIESANVLARKFAAAFGDLPNTVDFKFYETDQLQAKGMWDLAVAAFEHVNGTDVEDALTILENERETKYMRGGKRENAGRKPGINKISYSTRLSIWVVAWLKAQPNQAKAIETALVKYYKLKGD